MAICSYGVWCQYDRGVLDEFYGCRIFSRLGCFWHWTPPFPFRDPRISPRWPGVRSGVAYASATASFPG